MNCCRSKRIQTVSCAADESKYCSMCTVTLDPCGDLPFTSWGHWQCLRGGADGLNGCSAACGCGTEKKERRLQHIRHVRACRGRGQGRGLRAMRAGQLPAAFIRGQDQTPIKQKRKRIVVSAGTPTVILSTQETSSFALHGQMNHLGERLQLRPTTRTGKRGA